MAEKKFMIYLWFLLICYSLSYAEVLEPYARCVRSIDKDYDPMVMCPAGYRCVNKGGFGPSYCLGVAKIGERCAIRNPCEVGLTCEYGGKMYCSDAGDACLAPATCQPNPNIEQIKLQCQDHSGEWTEEGCVLNNYLIYNVKSPPTIFDLLSAIPIDYPAEAPLITGGCEKKEQIQYGLCFTHLDLKKLDINKKKTHASYAVDEYSDKNCMTFKRVVYEGNTKSDANKKLLDELKLNKDGYYRYRYYIWNCSQSNFSESVSNETISSTEQGLSQTLKSVWIRFIRWVNSIFG